MRANANASTFRAWIAARTRLRPSCPFPLIVALQSSGQLANSQSAEGRREQFAVNLAHTPRRSPPLPSRNTYALQDRSCGCARRCALRLLRFGPVAVVLGFAAWCCSPDELFRSLARSLVSKALRLWDAHFSDASRFSAWLLRVLAANLPNCQRVLRSSAQLIASAAQQSSSLGRSVRGLRVDPAALFVPGLAHFLRVSACSVLVVPPMLRASLGPLVLRALTPWVRLGVLALPWASATASGRFLARVGSGRQALLSSRRWLPRGAWFLPGSR